MRVAVLIVGLLGAVAAGLFGFFFQQRNESERAETQKLLIVADFAVAIDPKTAPARDEARELVRRQSILPTLLYIGGAIGVLAAVFALDGNRRSAASLFLVAALGPVLFNPRSIILTSGLALAALLTMFIRPRRASPVVLPED